MQAYKNRLIDILSNAYSGIRKEMWVLAIAMLINRSGSMVLLFMSVYLTKQKHFTIAEAGFIMGLFGAGSFVGAFVGGKLVDRIGFYPILISSLVLSAICMISLAYVDHFFWIGLLTFLVTSTGDMFRPANAASISTYSEPENYPQSIALNRLAMNIGFTLGPVIGGILASYNYTFLFWADGLTCISAAFFLWWQLPRKKQIKKESKESQLPLVFVIHHLICHGLFPVADHPTAVLQKCISSGRKTHWLAHGFKWNWRGRHRNVFDLLSEK
jgi:predicted MFS family arabinose efflux permease